MDRTGFDDMAEEMEADEMSTELQGENGTACFGAAKWFDSKGLVKQFIDRLGLTRGEASDAIHRLKKFNGLGAADNIGIDSAGGAWDKLGNFLGFIDEFIQ